MRYTHSRKEAFNALDEGKVIMLKGYKPYRLFDQRLQYYEREKPDYNQAEWIDFDSPPHFPQNGYAIADTVEKLVEPVSKKLEKAIELLELCECGHIKGQHHQACLNCCCPKFKSTGLLRSRWEDYIGL